MKKLVWFVDRMYNFGLNSGKGCKAVALQKRPRFASWPGFILH